jgi:hypothetical protein
VGSDPNSTWPRGERCRCRTPYAVRVESNLIPSAALTVYAVPRIGARQLLGSVPSSSTRVLTFNPVGDTGEYVFAAETLGGAVVSSNPLLVTAPTTVVWDLTSNIATVQ